MDKRQSREAKRIQEQIDRRLADKRILGALAEHGFSGPLYDRFVQELARYGVSVLRAWLHSGYIFKLVAERGFGLQPHELDLEELASNSDLREELATMTVALALPRFRERAFIEKGWSYEGGASITTYFMGACAYDFPNEFRKYRAAEERQRRSLRQQQDRYEPRVTNLSVADEVLGNLRVLDTLTDIDDLRTRAAVALTLDGYTQAEIQELLDAKSERAIEALIYRWRTKTKKQARKEGEQRG
ncbi:hypothetical protein BX281_1528 [Streptomyces sp. Ag82_O1-15]|uniref:hypothetical protein n=1 Tax=Streptomyces sp. Ag82_O1-15 TaxID=1938855 RepID=UPI000BC81056|nr:hypothetical protein [Streptomyces sp. Ag82_O1-15]PBC93690.1 hypothetical protein BX281_1528 [Streptomyces sp. Ag82_O1-15]